jgi:CTP synthase (UTP-ammonia lyase)
MACIEAARNTAGVKGAGSSEFGECQEPVVGLIVVVPSRLASNRRVDVDAEIRVDMDARVATIG